MCGICGIIDFKGREINKSMLKHMNELLYHRGPDDEGYYYSNNDYNRSPNVGIGMRRLSIIDLEKGHQPIHNEDDSIWIVFNGEIYNFIELREKLLKKGHKFYTKTDTEVIVHLYEDYGENCLKYINGMFAFAVWDDRKKQIFMARDRVGKKPLYYTRINDKLYFASEIKSFIDIPEFKKRINRKAIHYYLTYQYVPSPMTIFKGVKRLEPANYMVVDSEGNIKQKRYWRINFLRKTNLDFKQSQEKIKELLFDSTKIRMISDVPLGAFLSGGHDSSIITGIMSELSNRPVKTFSIGFKEEEFSELKYARIVAEKFKCEHNEFIVEPDYIDILPKIVWHYDQPYADSSALPSYYVAKMTREHVKVALNGDGGDENFAGYLRHAALKGSQWASIPFNIMPKYLFNVILNIIPSVESTNANHLFRYARRFFSAMKSSPAERNIMWHCYFNNQSKYSIYSQDMKDIFKDDDSYNYLRDLFEHAPAKGIMDRALFTDINAYLPEDLLVKMDVATMANSLETRSPFLDYRLLEFTASLPSKWKLFLLDKKFILKKTFKQSLPEEIYHRKKQGFGIPVGKWFREQWKDYFNQVVLSRKAISRGYFDSTQLKELFREHTQGQRDHGYRLWALLMLEMWHNVFIDK
ncbi:MAG: asparagine synthase (glutamine-hydrolyzing) [Elusimicrobiota bacterium]